MNGILSLLKNLDLLIFQQLDDLKNNHYFQAFTDRISTYDNEKQKIIYQSVSLFIISLPLMILFIVWIFSLSLKSELTLKKDIQAAVDDYHQNASYITSFIASQVIPTNIKSTKDLNNKIQEIVSKAQLNSEKVKTLSYKLNSLSRFKRINADISFNDFSTGDFTKFINAIYKNKFNILNLSIIRNSTNETIKGDLHITGIIKK